MYCKNCGSKVTDETTYCTNCGYKISGDGSKSSNSFSQNNNNKNPINSAPGTRKAPWRNFGVIIAFCIFIAIIVYLLITSDMFAFRPDLEGNTYSGYYVSDGGAAPVHFTITIDEHRFNDFSGSFSDDELGEALFYGSFTGRYEFYFNVNYDSSEHFYIYQYTGIIDYENQQMTGRWAKNDGFTYGDFTINID